MAEREVKASLKLTLEKSGALQKLRDDMRAEVFKVLNDSRDSDGPTGDGIAKPFLSNENLLINELIREYLEFNGYNHSCSALLHEAGQPLEPLDREFLTKELNLEETPSSAWKVPDSNRPIPLMYSIVHQCIAKSTSSSVLKR